MKLEEDPAWLDAQYNNRLRVPEHGQVIERWQKASAWARERSSCRLDVAYGNSPAERLDVFPAPHANAPVLVFIHGGWWRSLDKRDHSFIAPAFNQAGAMVVLPNHAMCPAVSIDDIVLQMVRAVAWTFRHAALYGGDPKRIVVAGHSAGGHLATMLLSCQWPEVARDLPASLVSSALAISGIFDLEPIARTPFLQADLHLSPAAVARLSPARFERPRGVITAVVGALESEEFLRQTQLIQAAWGAGTVPVCEAIEGLNHFDILQDLADPDTRLHRLARDLLKLP